VNLHAPGHFRKLTIQDPKTAQNSYELRTAEKAIAKEIQTIPTRNRDESSNVSTEYQG